MKVLTFQIRLAVENLGEFNLKYIDYCLTDSSWIKPESGCIPGVIEFEAFKFEDPRRPEPSLRVHR